MSQPVFVGDIVRTNYGTGPYEVIDVDGPCTCPEYIREIEGDETPSPEHYHITCRGLTERYHGGKFWLNGYVLRGSRILNVWNRNDEIFIVKAGVRQQELFEEVL